MVGSTVFGSLAFGGSTPKLPDYIYFYECLGLYNIV